MPKITSVERQKQNPRRFNIFLDDQFAFGADEDVIVNFRLIPGKVLDITTLELILYETQVGKLMERMYNLFSIRQRSEKEVRNYYRIKNQELRIKGKEEVSELVIESLIQKLKDKGLINDLEFAKLWVDSRRKNKFKSLKAIKVELIQKGINKEIIDEVTQTDDNTEELLAKKSIEKKIKHWQSLSKLELRKKIYEYLARRGFHLSTINMVLKEFIV